MYFEFVKFKKKYFLLLINIISFAEEQHPQFAINNVLSRECPTCERIYTKKNQMNYLNQTRLQFLRSIENWLKYQPNSVTKKTINSLIVDLKNISDQFINNLAHDAKISSYFNSIKALIKQIDPYLPDSLKLERQNFYETMQEIWNIDNDLESQAVPGNYNYWLTKRISLLS